MHAMASKKIKRLALSICLALGSILPAGAEEFLPLSDVREGMHGYAKTVVHGTKIDTFDVDVLGIMKNKGSAGGDLVLVKVSGPLIDETGGIAVFFKIYNGIAIVEICAVFNFHRSPPPK